jgi:hypothetical protein
VNGRGVLTAARSSERKSALLLLADGAISFCAWEKTRRHAGRKAQKADEFDVRNKSCERSGADNPVLARIPGTKVAKANDADDQPVDCQAAAPAQGAEHGAGA